MNTLVPDEKSPANLRCSHPIGEATRVLDQFRLPSADMNGCWKWALQPLLIMTLIGCASDGRQATEVGQSNVTSTLQQHRERAIQAAWVGKRYDSLHEAFGEPKLQMNILGYRPLKTSLAVYGMLDQSSKCVDAFTMVKLEDTGEWVVADYFCR